MDRNEGDPLTLGRRRWRMLRSFRRWDERGKLPDQFGNMDCGDSPNSFMLNFAVIMRQHMTLGLDWSPRNLRVRRLKGGRDTARRLTKNLDLTFHIASQHEIGQVIVKGPVSNK